MPTGVPGCGDAAADPQQRAGHVLLPPNARLRSGHPAQLGHRTVIVDDDFLFIVLGASLIFHAGAVYLRLLFNLHFVFLVLGCSSEFTPRAISFARPASADRA
jgi:hypothetical protein